MFILHTDIEAIEYLLRKDVFHHGWEWSGGKSLDVLKGRDFVVSTTVTKTTDYTTSLMLVVHLHERHRPVGDQSRYFTFEVTDYGNNQADLRHLEAFLRVEQSAHPQTVWETACSTLGEILLYVVTHRLAPRLVREKGYFQVPLPPGAPQGRINQQSMFILHYHAIAVEVLLNERIYYNPVFTTGEPASAPITKFPAVEFVACFPVEKLDDQTVSLMVTIHTRDEDDDPQVENRYFMFEVRDYANNLADLRLLESFFRSQFLVHQDNLWETAFLTLEEIIARVLTQQPVTALLREYTHFQ
jgi:hypothetical protein